MMAPAVILLLIWMIVPLSMTLWYSFQNYNLLNPAGRGFAGWFNYVYFYTDPAFFQAIANTLIIVVGDHETGGMSIGFAGTQYETFFEKIAHQKESYEAFDRKIAACGAVV